MEKFMEKQQTIAKRVSLNGIALHTGVRATLTLNPAEENTGIIFRRIDLPGKPEVKALASNVVDARRGTTIGNEKCAVYTIEHIMSALHVFGIDNCIVDMDGTEPPILDGSANGFFNLVKEAGIVQQDAEALYYEVKTPFYVRHEDTHIGIFPGDKLHIACTASFIGCPIDPQYFSLDVTPETYEKEIAGARTFVNFSDLRQLIGMGLCKAAVWMPPQSFTTERSSAKRNSVIRMKSSVTKYLTLSATFICADAVSKPMSLPLNRDIFSMSNLQV